MLPETVAIPDSKGVHKGTSFDDAIYGGDYAKVTADGYVTIDGGGGQDLIDATGVGASHLLGGVGNDFLIGGSDEDLLEGGAGADRIAGGERERHRQLRLLEGRRHRRSLQQQQQHRR